MERRTELETKSRSVGGTDLVFPPKAAEQYWSTTTTHLIFRPGSNGPEKVGSSKDAADHGSDSHRLLNDLGAEGWELVSDAITNSTVSTFWGWPNSSSLPIRREWTLKREVVAHGST